jgi:hypothetical protein
MKQVFKFSEHDFKILRGLRLLMGLVMIGAGFWFISMINILGKAFPVSERTSLITLFMVLLTVGGVYGIIAGLCCFFNGLKNSNVVKRDEISIENGVIEYKKSVHFQEDEHTNAYTEHYLYRIYNIKKVRRFVYNTVIIGDITREYLNKDDGEEVKVLKKVRIPNYFGTFEKYVKEL